MAKLYILGGKHHSEEKNIILWNNKCIKSNKVRDIFSLIDKNNLTVRRRYLEWISEIKIIK